jgi:hypothetical protein
MDPFTMGSAPPGAEGDGVLAESERDPCAEPIDRIEDGMTSESEYVHLLRHACLR